MSGWAAGFLLLIVVEIAALFLGVSISLHADHGIVTYADRWGIAAFMAGIFAFFSFCAFLGVVD